jgi:hypothetical protein
METLKKNRGRALPALLLSLCFMIGFAAVLTLALGGHALPAAHAQDPGFALPQIWVRASGTATNGVTVAVPPAGFKYIAEDILLTSGTSGVVDFYDSPVGSGTGIPAGTTGTKVFSVNVIANTPVELTKTFLSDVGFVSSTANNSLVAVQSGATVSTTCRETYR